MNIRFHKNPFQLLASVFVVLLQVPLLAFVFGFYVVWLTLFRFLQWLKPGGFDLLGL